MLVMSEIGVALAGLGTVGRGVLRNLERNCDLIEHRCGHIFPVRAAAVRNMEKYADFQDKGVKLTTDPLSLAERDDVQIVVELMGGEHPALELAENTMKAGKAFVTANKALLASHGAHLMHLARKYSVPFCFEASVAGGIPILKALREGLVANHISSITGIVNGTCNYILSSMSDEGMGFEEALLEAQRLGFAEAEPSLDIDGFDAMHKAIILAALAYGAWPNPGEVYVRGIRSIEVADVRFAAQLGYSIKLLAVIKRADAGKVELHVQPNLVHNSHLLSSVSGSFNALVIEGDVVGQTVFTGRGAGADPTASAVIADLVEASRNMKLPHEHLPTVCCESQALTLPYEETCSAHYLRFTVLDKPGTLAKIAGILAAHAIGISSALQPGQSEGAEEEYVPLILIVHVARQRSLIKALSEIEKSGVTRGGAAFYRVAHFPGENS